MAFFDDVGKRLSTTGQNAVNKAKEVAEVAKINSMISDEENKINTNYYQIGKLYVTKHANNYENDFATLINEILHAQKKISEFKEQIQTIKGIVKCEKCGAEVSINSAFCNSCGAPMPRRTPATQTENRLVCPSCGKSVKNGMKFCTACGAPMPVTSSASESSVPTPKIQEKICPSCGFKTDDEETLFCNNCGTKMITAEVEAKQIHTNESRSNSPISHQNTKRCPKCGFETNDAELLFCTECGTKLI